ncbi:hypothetical protein [Burkholderia latens]|uniref:hypothetical protein n=1 Tax=Burkholderia latens TaxID=488446 RepID=UPI00158DDB58|nr:hypothetical protein [Burkholderia latens]
MRFSYLVVDQVKLTALVLLLIEQSVNSSLPDFRSVQARVTSNENGRVLDEINVPRAIAIPCRIKRMMRKYTSNNDIDIFLGDDNALCIDRCRAVFRLSHDKWSLQRWMKRYARFLKDGVYMGR